MPTTTINEVKNSTRENETPQQAPPTNYLIQVPNRIRCQPPRVAKMRTLEGQLIDSKRNNAKNTFAKTDPIIDKSTDRARSQRRAAYQCQRKN